MKLLFSYYLPSGGVETLHRIRAENLKQLGIECHLHYQRMAAGLQNISDIPTFITNEDQQIYELLQREKYDAIFVSSDFLMIERMRGWSFHGPLIYEVQGLGQHDQAVRTLSLAVPYLKAYCTAALYPKTEHLKELFASMLPGLKQFCIPNFLDTRQFYYRSHEPLASPVMGWVGRIEKNKNWRDFIAIGQELRKHVPNLQLWMFEDANLFEPEEKDAFERLIQEQGVSSYLVRHSNLPHKRMPDIYSMIGDSGGFLLSSSILEGFGYAVSEAMSCRCPVLSTDSDGVRSFIEHNVTGKFYPIGHIPQAASEALELMNNAKLREQIRSQGAAQIHVHYNPELYCIRFTQMLKELGLS